MKNYLDTNWQTSQTRAFSIPRYLQPANASLERSQCLIQHIRYEDISASKSYQRRGSKHTHTHTHTNIYKCLPTPPAPAQPAAAAASPAGAAGPSRDTNSLSCGANSRTSWCARTRPSPLMDAVFCRSVHPNPPPPPPANSREFAAQSALPLLRKAATALRSGGWNVGCESVRIARLNCSTAACVESGSLLMPCK